jgi:predicted metal-dependent phosphoesterase TrpH
VRIDLHTHSRVSDGTDSPAELVAAARAAGLDVVALTDHDTYDGWADAAAAAAGTGLVLVRGVEVSTLLDGVGVHLLGYLVDPTYAPLRAELAKVREKRLARLDAIVDRLADAGMPVSVEDVLAHAQDASAVGRPHVADAMVARGYVENRGEAFGRWLASGRPAYVTKYAPATEDAVRLVRAAGGVPVLAHPWGRSSRAVLTADVVARLASAGLAGLEVDHQDHGPQERADLHRLAGELGLVATGSSDYHGSGKADHALGVNTTAPQAYERLVDEARRSAAAAGRQVPEPAA